MKIEPITIEITYKKKPKWDRDTHALFIAYCALIMAVFNTILIMISV